MQVRTKNYPVLAYITRQGARRADAFPAVKCGSLGELQHRHVTVDGTGIGKGTARCQERATGKELASQCNQCGWILT